MDINIRQCLICDRPARYAICIVEGQEFYTLDDDTELDACIGGIETTIDYEQTRFLCTEHAEAEGVQANAQL